MRDKRDFDRKIEKRMNKTKSNKKYLSLNRADNFRFPVLGSFKN